MADDSASSKKKTFRDKMKETGDVLWNGSLLAPVKGAYDLMNTPAEVLLYDKGARGRSAAESSFNASTLGVGPSVVRGGRSGMTPRVRAIKDPAVSTPPVAKTRGSGTFSDRMGSAKSPSGPTKQPPIYDAASRVGEGRSASAPKAAAPAAKPASSGSGTFSDRMGSAKKPSGPTKQPPINNGASTSAASRAAEGRSASAKAAAPKAATPAAKPAYSGSGTFSDRMGSAKKPSGPTKQPPINDAASRVGPQRPAKATTPKAAAAPKKSSAGTFTDRIGTAKTPATKPTEQPKINDYHSNPNRRPAQKSGGHAHKKAAAVGAITGAGLYYATQKAAQRKSSGSYSNANRDDRMPPSAKSSPKSFGRDDRMTPSTSKIRDDRAASSPKKTFGSAAATYTASYDRAAPPKPKAKPDSVKADALKSHSQGQGGRKKSLSTASQGRKAANVTKVAAPKRREPQTRYQRDNFVGRRSTR